MRRPAPPAGPLPALAERARWLARFRPPFEFGDFFAPEDTVLCALATAWALRTHRRETGRAPRRVVELTCGGAVVAFAQLFARRRLRAWGADVDDAAVARARRNALALGLADRARFRTHGLFDAGLDAWLARVRPDVVACNPPYIPEPPDQRLALVAGAGSDGADHPRQALTVAAAAGVRRLVLSWCSLGDPVGVARHAAAHGYALEALWIAAIADGEYSGMAHAYARTLPTAFLREAPATLAAVAPDGAARFAYLLLCGSFVRREAGPSASAHPSDAAANADPAPDVGVRTVAAVVDGFTQQGLEGLAAALPPRPAPDAPAAGPRVRAYVADRWDELVMRALAHGEAAG